MPNGSQRTWVQTVLGVGAAKTFDALTADLGAARAGLFDARDKLADALAKADAQVRKLQAVLAVYPDEQLKEIAGSPDIGINALTGNYRVRVLAALRDIETATPDKLPAALKKASILVSGFTSHIGSSDRIDACENNWLKVPVKLRETINPALADLSRGIDKFAA
jgi:hypothetical protein